MSPAGYAALAYVVGLGLMLAYGIRLVVLVRRSRRRGPGSDR